MNRIFKVLLGDKGYFTAVKDVSLDINDSEFLVILGPGRCDKAVLLSIITGLEQQTEGKAAYNGREWKSANPEISMVFQKLALMSFKTIAENAKLSLRSRDMSKGQHRRIAQHHIEPIGLRGFEKSYPTQLLGGMKQRMGTTRVYAADPELLIMGEPFGRLNAQARYQVQEGVLRIWEKEKRTAMFVTNNIEEARYLGDRIVLLSDCPTTVKEVCPIDIPRPRDMVNGEFLKLRTVIFDNTNLTT